MATRIRTRAVLALTIAVVVAGAVAACTSSTSSSTSSSPPSGSTTSPSTSATATATTPAGTTTGVVTPSPRTSVVTSAKRSEATSASGSVPATGGLPALLAQARQAAVRFVGLVCPYRWDSPVPYGVTYNRALTLATPRYAAAHRYSPAKTAEVHRNMVADREVQLCSGYEAFDAEGAFHTARVSVVHVSVHETQSATGVPANGYDDTFQYRMVRVGGVDGAGGRWLVDAETEGG